ncbi:MAG: acyl-CoA dehydrogenase family protein [Acidimicrobiales bacterium]|nr:acyl-CoA dehydrogenase family protein [Acidimicrobiales bacterium]
MGWPPRHRDLVDLGRDGYDGPGTRLGDPGRRGRGDRPSGAPPPVGRERVRVRTRAGRSRVRLDRRRDHALRARRCRRRRVGTHGYRRPRGRATLANAAKDVAFARPMVHRAAHGLDTDDPDAARDVSTAKALASDAATLTAEIALQCHGAIGYTVEYDLHLWLKRVWALSRAWGDATHHRAKVAESLGLT